MADSDMKPDSTEKPARPRRRWYQFTLRTAGIGIFLLCLLLGLFVWWRDRAERQRKVVEELTQLGVVVSCQPFSLTKKQVFDDPPMPEDEFFLNAWVSHFLGDHFIYTVDSVNLAAFNGEKTLPPETMRSALRLLQQCSDLRNLTLDGDTVTGADLQNTPYIETLEALFIIADSYDRQVLTDDDLVFYCGEKPHYHRPRGFLRDGDLAIFESAMRLEYLNLENQPIGDKGVLHLRNCQRLQTLMLRYTCVTDAALDHLHDLPELSYLSLLDTRVTDAGRKRFRERHPNCTVE